MQKRMKEYCWSKNDMGEAVEDFDEFGKLGRGFRRLTHWMRLI
jgi:hypothetical protein